MTRFAAQTLCLFVLCSLYFAPPCQAAPAKGGDFGIGVFLGEPTGLTLKGFVHREHAIVGYFSWDFTDAGFAAMVDWQYHIGPFVTSSVLEFGMLVGAGGKLAVRGEKKKRDSEKVAVGARIPVGLWLRFRKVPLELTLEVAPGIRLAPATDPDIDGGLGLRFFF